VATFSEEHAGTAAGAEGLEQRLITMHDQGRVGSAAYDGAIAAWNAERDPLAKIAEAAIRTWYAVSSQPGVDAGSGCCFLGSQHHGTV
jgi:hypothetical protein